MPHDHHVDLIKKTKTVVRILQHDGMHGVVRVVRNKLDHSYRPDEIGIAFDLLQLPGYKGVMIDVGAHHGDSLLPFANAGWQVFAFEPDHVNRTRLIEQTGIFPNVHVDARAVSDRSEQGRAFFRSVESDGVSSLKAFLSTHEQAGLVDVTSLFDFFGAAGLNDLAVDFLKIDTEGFDLMVLKGVPWDQVKPRMILCEFEDTKTMPLGYSFHMLAGYLKEKGYHLVVSEWQPIRHYGELHHWRCFNSYPCRLQHARAWGNIFAVWDEALYNRLLVLCGLSE